MGKCFLFLVALCLLGGGCEPQRFLLPRPLKPGEVKTFLISSSCREGEFAEERFAAVAEGLSWLEEQTERELGQANVRLARNDDGSPMVDERPFGGLSSLNDGVSTVYCRDYLELKEGTGNPHDDLILALIEREQDHDSSLVGTATEEDIFIASVFNPDTAPKYAKATAHETGHAIALWHDGVPGGLMYPMATPSDEPRWLTEDRKNLCILYICLQ